MPAVEVLPAPRSPGEGPRCQTDQQGGRGRRQPDEVAATWLESLPRALSSYQEMQVVPPGGQRGLVLGALRLGTAERQCKTRASPPVGALAL